MALPSPYSPIWRKLVSGEKECDFEFLATKIFIGRARVVLLRDNSPQTVESLATGLRNIFHKNQSHPAVERDIAKLV
jgi:hypothetical protein